MRMSAEDRKKQILEVSAELCNRINYKMLTKKMIANRAKISKSLINYHFKSMKKLRMSLIAYACHKNIYHVIAQGLFDREPLTVQLPRFIKEKASRWLYT